MNEKVNRNLVIAVVTLAVLLAVSIGFNFGFGRSVADNNRLRELQRELDGTIAELAAERDAERTRVGRLTELNGEAVGIIREALATTSGTGPGLARANEILRSVISALQSLELLYGGGNVAGSNGVGSLGGE